MTTSRNVLAAAAAFLYVQQSAADGPTLSAATTPTIIFTFLETQPYREKYFTGKAMICPDPAQIIEKLCATVADIVVTIVLVIFGYRSSVSLRDSDVVSNRQQHNY
ncbi:hypothetical protein J6590_031239 [Homalodisca vitripennis]|nr:hypothetical protein J6590_031239 [Homalodisca vitripennis]